MINVENSKFLYFSILVDASEGLNGSRVEAYAEEGYRALDVILLIFA